MVEAKSLGSVLVDAGISCRHGRTEVRSVTIADGRKQLVSQCLECGQRANKGWLPQKEVNAETVPPFDYELESQGSRLRQNEMVKRRRREQLERHLEYERFIQDSPKWQEARERVLKRDGRLCQACLARIAIQVHHLTYEHFKQELMWELQSVCRPCHERIHSLILDS